MAANPIAANPIDVWDVRTFDSALVAVLEEHSHLVRNYFEIDHRIFMSHDLGRGPSRSILRPENPYASGFYDLLKAIGREMEQRTIRAFHYTRLTDSEVESLKHHGVHLSTPVSLQGRLDAAVLAGDLTRCVADKLYAESPFHSDQLNPRSGKFWMTSRPIAINNGGVAPLLKHWGGEAASMWIRNEAVSALLASLGKPRIVELAAPLSGTRHSCDGGRTVVATFARSRGSIRAIRLIVIEKLSHGTPSAVPRIVETR